MFGKSTKEKFGTNIRAYKAEYIIEPKWEKLFALLAEKEGYESGDKYWEAINTQRKNGFAPPDEFDLMDQHKFSKYVDLESGMEIGFDFKKKQVRENYGHVCHILYDNKNNTDLDDESKPYSTADFSISIGSFYLSKPFRVKQIELAKYSIWLIEKLFVQLENSQSGMALLIVKSFPPKIEEYMAKNKLVYVPTEYFEAEETEKPDFPELKTDYAYAYKSDGLKFYDKHCNYHRFETEYLKIGMNIRSFDSNRFILENKI